MFKSSCDLKEKTTLAKKKNHMKVNSIFEDDSVTPHYGDSGKEEREKKRVNTVITLNYTHIGLYK